MTEGRHQGWTAVLRVLHTPGQVFEQLAEEPSLMPPYFVGTVLGGAAALLSLPTAFRLMESQVAHQGLQMDPTTNTWMVIGGVFGALVGPILSGLVVTSILFGMLWLGGQHVTFKPLLSIVGYARIPIAIEMLINAVLIAKATNPEQTNRISLSLAALAPSGTPWLLFNFLSTLAPLDFWYLVLITVGVAAVTRRRIADMWWTSAVLYGLNLVMMTLGSGLSSLSLK